MYYILFIYISKKSTCKRSIQYNINIVPNVDSICRLYKIYINECYNDYNCNKVFMIKQEKKKETEFSQKQSINRYLQITSHLNVDGS